MMVWAGWGGSTYIAPRSTRMIKPTNLLISVTIQCQNLRWWFCSCSRSKKGKASRGSDTAESVVQRMVLAQAHVWVRNRCTNIPAPRDSGFRWFAHQRGWLECGPGWQTDTCTRKVMEDDREDPPVSAQQRNRLAWWWSGPSRREKELGEVC